MERLALAKDEISDTQKLGSLLEDVQLAVELLELEVCTFMCQTGV